MGAALDDVLCSVEPHRRRPPLTYLRRKPGRGLVAVYGTAKAPRDMYTVTVEESAVASDLVEPGRMPHHPSAGGGARAGRDPAARADHPAVPPRRAAPLPGRRRDAVRAPPAARRAGAGRHRAPRHQPRHAAAAVRGCGAAAVQAGRPVRAPLPASAAAGRLGGRRRGSGPARRDRQAVPRAGAGPRRGRADGPAGALPKASSRGPHGPSRWSTPWRWSCPRTWAATATTRRRWWART